MKFLPVSEADRAGMVAAIGAPSVDALFASIPAEVRREPTETEGRPGLDAFIAAMRQIAREAEEDPDVILKAPHTTPVKRVDEVAAARNFVLRWRP